MAQVQEVLLAVGSVPHAGLILSSLIFVRSYEQARLRHRSHCFSNTPERTASSVRHPASLAPQRGMDPPVPSRRLH